MELVSTVVPRDFFYSAIWLASLDYQENPSDTHVIQDIDAVSYISDIMSRFVSDARSLAMFTDAQTLTERIIAAENAESSQLFRENADFALFSAGMFPERLMRYELREHYEKRGAVSYLHAFQRSDFPTFHKLAYRFRHFEGVITNARNNYMNVVEEKDEIKIVPVYEKIRDRVVFS